MKTLQAQGKIGVIFLIIALIVGVCGCSESDEPTSALPPFSDFWLTARFSVGAAGVVNEQYHLVSALTPNQGGDYYQYDQSDIGLTAITTSNEIVIKSSGVLSRKGSSPIAGTKEQWPESIRYEGSCRISKQSTTILVATVSVTASGRTANYTITDLVNLKIRGANESGPEWTISADDKSVNGLVFRYWLIIDDLD